MAAAAKGRRTEYDPHHSRKKQDLTGHRYGKLTVIGPAPNIGVRTAWRCVCDCGNERIVRSVDLRDGHTPSCGCAWPMVNGHTDLNRVLTYVDGTCVEMLRGNMTPRKNNTSGVVGVEWVESKGRWRATLCFKGRRRYLGMYKTLEEAAAARKKAEEEIIEPFLAQFPK